MTKEQLKAYRTIKLERDKLADMLAELEAIMYGPTISKLSAVPGGGRSGSSPVENAAAKHEELLTRYQRKVEELTVALSEIEAAIETLNNRDRTLVRLYYIQGKTWEEVCVEMAYSWRQVHRIHAAVLMKLKDK